MKGLKSLALVGLCVGLLLSFTSASLFAQTKMAYKEAPVLAKLVKEGKLPPVNERLPKEPFVVGPGVLITKEDLPDWQVGKYGGTLRAAHSVADWAPDIFIMLNEPLLCAPGIGLDGIKGNILKSFEVSKDNRVFTFRIREGLKWSDGHPVTTEDILFTYEDVLLNEKITPVFPAKFRDGGKPDGKPMKLEVLDEYTFRISFGQPYGGFLRELTVKGWVGYTDLLKPKHYLKQFHIRYTPIEKLKPLLEKEQLKDEWWNLFNLMDFTNWEQTKPQCAGFPVLTPWMIVKSPSGVLVFERNPYYFKVDTEGNQLPYIDTIKSVQVQDVEMVNMKVLTGEVDFLRESTALVKVPLYKENEKKAGFRVHLLDMHVDSSAFYLNLTYDDPVWRKVVRDLRFRRALNLGINRKEIIDTVYYGFASLPETVPSEYNPKEANRLLDEMGLNKRDKDGFRLGPDGKTFVIPIECGAHAPDLMPVSELLVEHFKALGIKATLKKIEPSLWGQRAAANQLQASLIWAVQPMWRDGTWTDYLPTAQWGREWERWYTTNGKEGEKPPEDVMRLYEIHEGRMAAIPYSQEDKKLTEEMYSLYRKNIYCFIIAEKVKYPLIAAANLGNIPRSGQAIAANYSAEQFFFKK